MKRELDKRKLLTHGYSQHQEYDTWRKMVARCTRPATQHYSNYGGRGIKVCIRWEVGEHGKHPFECFLEDMGVRPSEEYSLDRIDNDGDYTPENCRWATLVQQATNRRTSRFVELDGELVTISEASRRTGMGWSTIARRLARGMSPEEVFSVPVKGSA